MLDPQGAFIRSLDAGDRIALPPSVAKVLPPAVVLAPDFDRSIRLYGKKQWDSFAMELMQLNPNDPDQADLLRFYASMSKSAEVDKSNRLRLPEALMKWAGLDQDHRDVHLHDAGEFVEIWEANAFQKYMEQRAPSLKQLARSIFGTGRREEGSSDAAAGTPTGDGR